MRIDWHEAAVADLRRLDPAIRRRIRHVLHEELAQYPDPRQKLEPYKGPLKGLWKLRIGDWRLICALESADDGPVLLIIMVAHRSASYERQGLRRLRARS